MIELPIANTSAEEPPMLACPRCGNEWRWIWHAPRGQHARWCAPKVSHEDGCLLCVVQPHAKAEQEIRRRLRVADVPEPLWRYSFERDGVSAQRSDETIDAFRHRVKLNDALLGVASVNVQALRLVWAWKPPKWMLMHGPPGTGKTTLLGALARKLLTPEESRVEIKGLQIRPVTQDGWDYLIHRQLNLTYRRKPLPEVRYFRVDELVDRERIKWKGDADPTYDAARVQVLLIDELGLEPKPHPIEVKVVERIVSYREEFRLCTVLASNRTLADLVGPASIYGARVGDRLRNALDIPLIGQSWRGE